MQANTAGDQYSYTLYQTDGVTALSLTGYTSVEVAIIHPSGTVDTSTAVNVTVNTSPTPSVASFTTTLAPKPTFPVDGAYQIQFSVTYASGYVSKSRAYPLTIVASYL